MGRKVGWGDKTITGGGRRRDRSKEFRAKDGEAYIIRVMTDCEEYRIHWIDDVLDPKEDGTERGFGMTCSKKWDDDSEDWIGECLGCDREYDTKEQYACGILLLGIAKGRGSFQTQDPENAPHVWTFGGDKYRELADIHLEQQELETPKKLNQIELMVKCKNEASAEFYQKLSIKKSERKALTTKAHVKVWKEEGQKLVDEAVKCDSPKDQARRLKKKKRGSSDDDGDDEKPKKSGGAKKKPKPKEEDPPEESEDDAGDDAIDDEEIDDLLSELDDD